MMSDELALLLESYRLPTGTEVALQDAIERILRRESVAHVREHRLSAQDRVDFLVSDGIACEVKTKGSLLDVTRQMLRYAQHDEVTSLVLVTSRVQLARLPKTLNGKAVSVAALLGAFT